MNKFVIYGLAAAFIIALLAPYLASSNPDGLESTAEKFNAMEHEKELFSSPFPDYSLPGMEEGISGVAAMVIGMAVILLLSYGVSRALAARN